VSSPDPLERPLGTREKLLIAAFGALIGFGCLLRFWKLADDGLWYDELWTVVGASDRPFMEMYREFMRGDPHPPGYFLFYFGWLELFPNDELWARLPNAIAGVLTVLFLLFGSRRVLSRDERIFASALAALSSLYIFYAVNVKQYSAVIFLATVATISYLEIANERRVAPRTGTVFTATLIGLAYLNHFAMVYAWVLLALLALTFRGTPDVLRPLGKIAIVFAVTYLPIAYFLSFPLLYSVNTEQSEASSLVAEIFPSLFFDDRIFVAAFLIAVIGLAVRSRSRLRSSRNRHVLLILTTFTSLLLALALVEPIFVLRYFIVLFPVALLGLAILSAAAFPISHGWLAALPIVFFARAAVVDFRAVDEMQRQQWDASVDLVLASAAPDDPIYVLGANPDRPMLDYLAAGDVDGAVYRQNARYYAYYFRRRGALDIAERLEVVEPTVEAARDLARRYRESGRTVYILAGHHIQLDDESVWTLEQAARRLETTWLYSTIVYEIAF
jgi:uncharacterized membrane protein